MSKLNLDGFELEPGQVRSVTSDGGKVTHSVELLLGSQTKAELALNDAKDSVDFAVSDTEIAEIPQLQCTMDKDTLRNFILGLKNLYNNMS